ncbi:myb-like protein AA [Leguminivora glycinivorella]|uniref:myb-like protein AA n=1 Tax=Leguminivora glycinivorella TaxID=1035111 RepID=UPI00200CB670|nr:myb-like protein AA [Leguminivora glycinivorella]
MAGKILILAFALSICKVHSQSIGCCSPSNSQSSCGPSQSQTINGIKASPQLQFVPGQNLQAINLSQLSPMSRPSNIQKTKSTCNMPKQSFQVTSSPQYSSSSCGQPSNVQCSSPCPQVITTPVSAITVPPTPCTTVIDCSLASALANALQLLIANDFINSAVNNKIINQNCLPANVETSTSNIDLNSLINNINNQQNYQCQNSGPTDDYDWEQLLVYLNGDKKKDTQTDKYDSFYRYIKEKGQTVDQIAQQPQTCDLDEDALLQLLATYFINNPIQSNYNPNQNCNYNTNQNCNYNTNQNCNYNTNQNYGSAAEVVFPEEIPAKLICNYGYIPTTMPVVSFSVQPLDPNCNVIVGGGQTC